MYDETLEWHYLTWQCSFFHPPPLLRHLLTSHSLGKAQFTVQPSRAYALGIRFAVVHTLRLDICARLLGTEGRKEYFPWRDLDYFGDSMFHIFPDNMRCGTLKGFLVILLVQQCTSEGRIVSCK